MKIYIYTVGKNSLYSRKKILIQSEKIPYTVGKNSLYSRKKLPI